MTLQEIFDKAARHLMHMDGPSMDTINDTCAYRGEDHGEFNGKMCAVGVFIKDEFYDEGFEGRQMNSTDVELHNAIAKSIGQEKLTQDQAELLAELQVAHDGPNGESNSSPDIWMVSVIKTLDQIAVGHGFPFDPVHINPHYLVRHAVLKGDAL